MGPDYHNNQRLCRPPIPHADRDSNPRDNTDTYYNSYASHIDSNTDPGGYATGDNAYAGDHANPNSTDSYADTSLTDTDSGFDTNTKPKSGPTGTAQQPLDSDASPDW